MADAYRKVGRGGAGNFYSKKDVEDVVKAQPTDLEAQKPAPADESPSDPAVPPSNQPQSSSAAAAAAGVQSSAPVYARTGRGGAGNFVDPVTASSSSITSHSQPHPAVVHSKGNQSFAQPSEPPRISGRGGAGNWASSSNEQKTIDEEQERKRREAIDKDIFADVKAGLQEPGRAHTRVHPHGRGAGATGFEES